jgi:NTP pyrophosphatase (non-canonical NTP hydrolase)
MKMNYKIFISYIIPMTLSFYDMQQRVDTRIAKTPDGYRWAEKMFDKMREEIREIEVAECEYLWTKNNFRERQHTEEKFKNLKTEIGDLIFAVCCLANVDWIHLQASFLEAIEGETQEVIWETQKQLYAFKKNREYWDLIYGICRLSNIYSIELEECFNLMMEKNERRANNGYKKEEK